jgi:hypothetical protein
LIGALNRDAGAHCILVWKLGKVARFGGGNQFLAQLQRSLSRENSPNRKHAISIEVIVGDQFNAARQFVSIRRTDEIQGNFSRRISLELRRGFVSFPVGKVDAVRNCAIDRKFGNRIKAGVIKLKTHRGPSPGIQATQTLSVAYAHGQPETSFRGRLVIGDSRNVVGQFDK